MTSFQLARLKNQLRKHEGWQRTPYQDTKGVWTVGAGHNLQNGPPLSDAAIELILDDDIADAERRCRRTFPWFEGLSDVRQTVVVELAFAMGLGGLGTFRNMLGAMVDGNWNRAADELLDSEWARDVGQRAHTLAEMLRSNQWQ
jgi:lysozyme